MIISFDCKAAGLAKISPGPQTAYAPRPPASTPFRRRSATGSGRHVGERPEAAKKRSSPTGGGGPTQGWGRGQGCLSRARPTEPRLARTRDGRGKGVSVSVDIGGR